MSHENSHSASHSSQSQEATPADSKADTIAIFALIMIAVITTFYFVAG